MEMMNMSEHQNRSDGKEVFSNQIENEETPMRTYGVLCSCANCGRAQTIYFNFGVPATRCMCSYCGCYTCQPKYYK